MWGGQCSIAFAKKGAKATGIDISKEQLKYAKKLAEKNKVDVKFIKKDIQTLRGIKSNSYDIVFSAYALQYIPNLLKCFKEVNRVLKKNGLFVFSFDHPFYSTIDKKTLKIKRSYFKNGKFEEMLIWPDSKKHKFIMYDRKVSDIINYLIDSKFTIEKIIEPFKLKGQKAWRGKEWNKTYPLKLVKLIGPTIIFKTRKK